jgi:hypothetical protein
MAQNSAISMPPKSTQSMFAIKLILFPMLAVKAR